MSIRHEEVAKYLKDHPEFFDDYAELLSTVQVRHPYGGRAIPLSERQVLALRERSRALEGKLRELVQFGEENDTTSDRVHRLSLALLAAPDLGGLIQAIDISLHEDFTVPEVALRLWGASQIDAGPEFGPVSEEARAFAEALATPYFCDRPMFESSAWFSAQAADLRSLVYLPLRVDRPFGLLAFGSPDPRRFSPDMGTLYLVRIAELISMALRRHLEF